MFITANVNTVGACTNVYFSFCVWELVPSPGLLWYDSYIAGPPLFPLNADLHFSQAKGEASSNVCIFLICFLWYCWGWWFFFNAWWSWMNGWYWFPETRKQFVIIPKCMFKKKMALENVKGSGKEKSLCLMCFAELDLGMKSLVNKSLAKCCSAGDVSPSHWPWFHCSLTFKLSQVMWCGKDCFDTFHKRVYSRNSAHWWYCSWTIDLWKQFQSWLWCSENVVCV